MDEEGEGYPVLEGASEEENGADGRPLPPKRRRTSEVWNHFRTQNSQVICSDCGKHFRRHTSTSSLRYHLRNVHQRELLGVSLAAGGRTQLFDGCEAEELLSRFIAKNCLPLRLVDDEDFRKFLHYLEPGWKPPDRRRLTSILLPELRSKLQTKMKQRMSHIQYYSISLDSWTSLNNTSYVAITCHGISTHWQLHSFLLDIVPVQSAETSAYIAQLVRDVLSQWNIALDCVVAGTTDGAANMKRAVREELGLLWLYCAGHALNRSLQVSFIAVRQVRATVSKANSICAYFRRRALLEIL